MTAATPMPYGTWPSALAAADLAAATVSLSDLHADGGDLWWIQSSPEEGGRYAVHHLAAGGSPAELSPPGFSARTRVHEYGGGALGVGHGVVLACSWADQRVHRLHPDRTATPVTPEPATPAGIRWAGMRVLPGGGGFVAVRETHGPDRPRDQRTVHGDPEAVNELVAVDLATGATSTLVTGPDFVAGPWLDRDGTRIAWLQWDHPDMPWDSAALWVGALVGSPSTGLRIADPRHLAGGRGADGTAVSVADALWLADGRLAFAADPDGWWNVHVWTPDDHPSGEGAGRASAGTVTRLHHEEVEAGHPRWVMGTTTLAEVGGEVVTAAVSRGIDHLRRLPADGEPQVVPADGITAVGHVVASGRDLVAVVGGPATPTAIRRIDPVTGEHVLLAGPADHPAARIGSPPRPITFATADGARAHALHYAPAPPDGVAAPEDERPPLVVLSHGGPTGAARTGIQPTAQYWASRGFAVVDVNYRGSTGYGRAYRDSLLGSWGLHDVADCIAAARHLAAEGHADPDRLVIEGGSAGGYTTLQALCTTDVFAAGGSLYGVADLRALATDTHKFESRYLDGLIGPWPAAEQTYVDRSPITSVDRLTTPMVVLQGDEDAIVPPAQAEQIVAALRAGGLPHAYLLFAGEQHGFRDPANITRALEARLAFYGRVLGFDPADPVALPEWVPGTAG